MSAARSKYAWIVLFLASIFIYLKVDAIPTSYKTSPQLSSQLVDTFYDFDDTFEIPSISKSVFKRSPDSDDNKTDGDESSDDNKDQSKTTSKPSDGGFHHGDHHHDHGTTRRTILKQPHPPHDHDDNDRNNNSGSGGFNILEFFGTIFRLVWGFFSNIPALLFGSSSSSSSGGQ